MGRTRSLRIEEFTTGEQVTPHIFRGRDGMLRWRCDLPMLRNPVIFITVLKVLALSIGIEYGMVMLIILCTSGLEWADFVDLTLLHAVIFLGLSLLGVLAYLVVAWTYGFKYRVLFEMDEEIIRHIQLPAQFQRAQKLGALTVWIGALAGRPQTMGAGLLMQSHSSTTCEFSRVKRVVIRRRLRTIKLTQGWFHNQIYAAPEDFDFVVEHIASHCVAAEISGR